MGMTIRLTPEDSPFTTVLDTPHDVEIIDPKIGPFIVDTNSGLTMAVRANGNGFEGCFWRGSPDSFRRGHAHSNIIATYIMDPSGLFLKKE